MDIEVKVYLYSVRNMFDGKQYIGQTVDPKRRWAKHKKNAMRPAESRRWGMVFYEAMREHGLHKFRFEILFSADSREIANELETWLIRERRTQVPDGYNVEAGGGVSERSEATRAKISAALTGKGKGRKASAESRARMSAAQREPELSTRRLLRLKARASAARLVLQRLHAQPEFEKVRIEALRSPEARSRSAQAQREAWARKKAAGVEDRNISGILRHSAVRKAATHCKRGHLLSPENLYPSALRVGSRSCRLCSALRTRTKHT